MSGALDGDPGKSRAGRTRRWARAAGKDVAAFIVILLGSLIFVALPYVLIVQPLWGPETHGDDTELDALWDACRDRDMRSCDALAGGAAPMWSEYEHYGQTCGHRVRNPELDSCVDLAPDTDADTIQD